MVQLYNSEVLTIVLYKLEKNDWCFFSHITSKQGTTVLVTRNIAYTNVGMIMYGQKDVGRVPGCSRREGNMSGLTRRLQAICSNRSLEVRAP